MKTTTFKQIIKEAVKEAVREVFNEEVNSKPLNENMSFTSEDAQAFGMIRNQLKSKMDQEFGFTNGGYTTPNTTKVIPKTINTPEGPKQLSIFDQALLETASELTPQDLAQFRSQA